MPDTIDTWDVVPVDDGNSWDDSVEIEDFEELPSTEFPTFPGLEPAEDDLVYWTRDKSLILVANAIRQKAGTTEKLVWPLGYRDAILGLSSIGSSQSSDSTVGQDDPGQSGTSQSSVININLTPVAGNDLVKMFVENSFAGGIADTAGSISFIAASRFSNSLEFAIFPAVTTISSYAFFNITTLSLVSLPLVTSIPVSAFNNCTALGILTTSPLTSIGSRAFYNCQNLSEINISDELSVVTGAAFYGCSKLKSFKFSQITSIAYGAFQSCRALESAIMPNLSDIRESAFENCRALSNVDVGNLSIILSCCFRSCSSLASVNASAVTSIYGSAFYGCLALEELSFPALKTVSDDSFAECSGLKSFYAPQLSTIGGASAFRNCRDLSTFVVASEFTNTLIPSQAFVNCAALSVFPGMPNAKRINYLAFGGAGIRIASFPEVQFCSNTAFVECRKLSIVDMPLLSEVNISCFKGCYELESVSLPKATKVAESAFAECYALTSITLPEVSIIGSNAFKSSGLLDLYLPGSKVCLLSFTSSNVTLHVPESLYNSYASYSSKFMSIVTI